MLSTLEEHTISHYLLQKRLTCGGMSEIYLATDTRTKQVVAIKLVHSDHRDDCRRFQREVQIMANLQHDHILPVFDTGEYGPWCYMVMPYIENGTLQQRLKQGPLTPKEAGKILAQVVSALQFAHDQGIIHRDIKPSNILLRDGEHVYLADFGLAKTLNHHDAITKEGHLLGTPEYMAPELVERPASKSGDIYALGIVLYQMLTGQVPFKSNNPMGIYLKHIQERPLPPSELNTALSPELDLVVLRALEKNPQHRFSSARELALAYRKALASTTPSATSVPLFMLQRTGTTGTTNMGQHLHTSRRTLVLAALAMVFLFVVPTWMGYAYYAFNTHAAPLLPATGAQMVGNFPPTHPIVPPTRITTTTTQSTPTTTGVKYPSNGHAGDNNAAAPTQPPQQSGDDNGGGHGHQGKHRDGGKHGDNGHGHGQNISITQEL